MYGSNSPEEAHMKTQLFLLSTVLIGACVTDESVDSTDYEDTPRLSANGLSPAQLANTALDAGVLNQTNLDTMAATDDGRVTLRYVIACALTSGHNVTANYTDANGNPATITFNGTIGLADGWTSTALSTGSQRWVSACVLSLVNELGASVTISQRGPSSTLATTSSEVTNYALQEGAFFGNVFKGGEGAAACKGSGTSTVTGRTCSRSANGSSTYCGFSYAGTCASVCTSGSYFTNCTWNGTTYSTPVSTYLTN